MGEDERPPEQIRFTAYHEAGHAVAFARAGFDLATMTIVPDNEKGTVGHVVPMDNWDTEEELRGLLVALYCGWAAQSEAGDPDAEDPAALLGWRRDFEEARDLVERYLPDEPERVWIERARAFVRQE